MDRNQPSIQPQDEPARDVLEHGAGEPGRLLAWSRSRTGRGVVAVLVAAAALAWLVAGPWLSTRTGPDAPAAPADAASEPAETPAAVLLHGARGQRGAGEEGGHRCEGESSLGGRSPSAVRTGRPAGLADPGSRALVAAMRDFAADPGRGSAVPWAPRVVLLAEGPVPVNRVVSATEAGRRATWTDPSYLLAGLAATPPERLRVDDEHHVTCRGQPRMQAAGFEGQPWVSVQPRVLDNSCRGWWAVDLYLDSEGRVSAVLVRS